MIPVFIVGDSLICFMGGFYVILFNDLFNDLSYDFFIDLFNDLFNDLSTVLVVMDLLSLFYCFQRELFFNDNGFLIVSMLFYFYLSFPTIMFLVYILELFSLSLDWLVLFCSDLFITVGLLSTFQILGCYIG